MNILINIDENEHFCETFGGEIEEINENGYGIQIGEVTISGIPSELMRELHRKISRHLISNGHTFEQKELEEKIRRELHSEEGYYYGQGTHETGSFKQI